jgi:ATP-dependent Clp protease ATP-binding subunit ClpC
MEVDPSTLAERAVMFERLTDRARKVMALANQEAQRFNHEYIGTEHILLGLVKEGSASGPTCSRTWTSIFARSASRSRKLVKSGPEMVTMGKLPQTPRAKKVIEYAIEEARALNHNYVGTEHLLLGLLREHDGVAAQVLMNLGLKLEEVREEVLNLLGADVQPDEGGEALEPSGGGQEGGGPSPGGGRRTKSKTPALDSFGRDLTELAKNGELDPGASAAPTRSNAWCRCSAGARRTTRCCWAKPAWARRPSSKASRSRSSARKCPTCCRIGASSCSTWR